MVRDNKIYLHKDVLDSPIDATAVLLHELIHRYQRVHDETIEFENELTNVAGFSTAEWQENKKLFNKSLDALKDNETYIHGETFKNNHPDIASYFEG